MNNECPPGEVYTGAPSSYSEGSNSPQSNGKWGVYMLPERRRHVWTPRNQEEGLTVNPTLGTTPLLPPSTPEAPGAAQKPSPSPKLLLVFLSPASPSPFPTSFSLPFFCSSNTPRMSPPQGLCACSSLCLEHPSLRSLQAWLLLSCQVSPPQSCTLDTTTDSPTPSTLT